jgi:hypothetical protein
MEIMSKSVRPCCQVQDPKNCFCWKEQSLNFNFCTTNIFLRCLWKGGNTETWTCLKKVFATLPPSNIISIFFKYLLNQKGLKSSISITIFLAKRVLFLMNYLALNLLFVFIQKFWSFSKRLHNVPLLDTRSFKKLSNVCWIIFVLWVVIISHILDK